MIWKRFLRFSLGPKYRLAVIAWVYIKWIDGLNQRGARHGLLLHPGTKNTFEFQASQERAVSMLR